MIAQYRTDPAAAVVPRWVPFGALWITHHPVEDPGPGLAHLTYAGALAVAAAAGARLPTTEEILALHVLAAAAGTELAPFILPDVALRAQGCVPGDGRMVTLEWCQHHDGPVLEDIQIHRDSDVAVANAGKHWRFGAPPGLAGLCGWWVPDVGAYGAARRGPGFVQEGIGYPHNDGHSDYATTCMLIRDEAP